MKYEKTGFTLQAASTADRVGVSSHSRQYAWVKVGSA